MDETKGVFRVMSFFNWVMQFIGVQLIWILLTALGLGLFGLFPATVAMFSITRKWIMGHTDIRPFKFMWQTYRREFIKANIYFYAVLFFGGVIYFYFKLFQGQGTFLTALLTIIMAILMIIYSLGVLIAMPVYAHYDLKLKDFFKMIGFTIISFPFHTLTNVVVYAVGGILIFLLPGFAPLITFSLLTYATMFIMTLAFKKIDAKEIVTDHSEV